MLIEHFFLDKEKYKTLSLKNRMIVDMIAYKANYIFSDTVIDIKVKEHPNDWRTNQDVYATIKDMKSQRDIGFEGKYHLERLYESEFGSITETVKTFIEESAKTYADVALKSFGWIKDNNETVDIEEKMRSHWVSCHSIDPKGYKAVTVNALCEEKGE